MSLSAVHVRSGSRHARVTVGDGGTCAVPREEAGAAHVSGTVGSGDDTQELDLQLQGEDVMGTITAGGQTVQLLTVGGVSYFQSDAEFWAGFGAPADAAGELDGRWVLVPPSRPPASVS